MDFHCFQGFDSGVFEEKLSLLVWKYLSWIGECLWAKNVAEKYDRMRANGIHWFKFQLLKRRDNHYRLYSYFSLEFQSLNTKKQFAFLLWLKIYWHLKLKHKFKLSSILLCVVEKKNLCSTLIIQSDSTSVAKLILVRIIPLIIQKCTAVGEASIKYNFGC